MRPRCLHPGCTNLAALHGTRGLCARHYEDRGVRELYPKRKPAPPRKPGQRDCIHPGCTNVGKNRKRGLCISHHADPAVRELYPMNRHKPAAKPPACVHCGGKGRVLARGLCSHCYYRKPGVRKLYPISDHPAVKGWVRKAEAVAFKPCPFPPFHPTRIETMQRRIALGQPLHHPGDAGNEARERVGAEAVEWASDLCIRGVVA